MFFFFCDGAKPGCHVNRIGISLTNSELQGAGMKIGLSAIGKIPYEVERYRPRNQNFILLGRLQPLLHLRVAPVRAGIQYFVVDHPTRRVDSVEGNAVRIRHARTEEDTIPVDNARMHLQENAIAYPAILPCDEFHRMVALEAQMHISVQIPSAINEAASYVTARRRNFKPGILKLGERKQSSPLADQVQVPPVSEVVQKRDSAERIDLRHADSLYDPTISVRQIDRGIIFP